jgi:hypothetical protein
MDTQRQRLSAVPEKLISRARNLDAPAHVSPVPATEISMSEKNENEGKPGSEDDKSKAEDMPIAGPHDKEELQDPMKTPGTGSLPEVGSRGTDVGPD